MNFTTRLLAIFALLIGLSAVAAGQTPTPEQHEAVREFRSFLPARK